jgi:hypothetical protein
MQRHLNKPRTAQGVLNHPKLSLRWKCIARIRIEAGIEGDVIVRRIEAGMVQNVKKIGLILQGKPLVDLGIFQD